MKRRFNLLDDPWILVVMNDGARAELGLHAFFEQSSEIAHLDCETEAENFALLRFLLAVVRRAWGWPIPNTDPVRAWVDLRDTPDVSVKTVLEYLDEFRDRFWLLGGDRPIYQVADLTAVTPENQHGSLSQLYPEHRKEGKDLFTTRSPESYTTISHAEAARRVIYVQAYSEGGPRTEVVGDDTVLKGRSYGVGPGPLGTLGGVHIEGGNLFETLLLNLAPGSVPTVGEDLPAWEQDKPPFPVFKKGRTPTGPLDVLTWQSRRLRLQTDDDGTIISVLMTNGDKLVKDNLNTIEYQSRWSVMTQSTANRPKGTVLPKQFTVDAESWRGADAILAQADRTPAPGVINWVRQLQRANKLEEKLLHIRTVGMVHQDAYGAVIIATAADELSAPLAAVADPAAGAAILRATRRASDATYAVERLASDLLRAAGVSREMKPRHMGAKRAAKQRMRTVLDFQFREWLHSLDPAALDAADADWIEKVRKAAWKVANELLRDSIAPTIAPGDTRDGVSAASAEKYFRVNLGKAIQ